MTRRGASCCVVLLGVLLCVFLVAPSRSQQPTFTFPNQWEAVVGGWFSDKLLPDARSTGYMYVDYTYGPNGAERIDEVWNITAIAGTEYAKWNIHSDVHMFYGSSFTDPGFFFYSNGTGSYCEASPSSLIGQYQFTNSYTGSGDWNNVPCNIFQTPLFPGGGNVTLYVSTQGNIPQAYLVPAIPAIGFLGSTIEIYRYIVKTEPLPKFLFALPSGCPSSSVLN